MRHGTDAASLVISALVATAALAQDSPPAADPRAVVKGRCVAAESGAPLAGCKVQFDGRPCNDDLMNLHGKPDWKDPEPVITGDDGRFEFRFVPPPPYQHSLDVSCKDRVPRTARWWPFQPGQVDDLGDVKLQRGYSLSGRVVDQDGKPVEGLGVSCCGLPLRLRRDAANDERAGWTKVDGTFLFDVPMPPGTWPIRITGGGCSLVAPESATVKAQEEPNVIPVRVQRMPSISGVVFDDRGQPVERVYLQARPGAGNWMTAAWSRKDGSFTIYKRDGSPDEVCLEIDDPGPCEVVPIEGLHSWDKHGLRIELPRALSFELTVVEAGSSKPVEAYGVQCYALREGGDSSRFKGLRLGQEQHPQGVVIVDKVWRGQNLLRVVPRDPALAISDVVEFEAAPGTIGPRHIELPRMQPIELQLEDAHGLPLANCSAWIVDDRSDGKRLHAGLFNDPRSGRTVGSPEPAPMSVAQSQGTTDGSGKVTLHHAPTRGKLAIVVLRAGKYLVHVGFDPATKPGARITVQ